MRAPEPLGLGEDPGNPSQHQTFQTERGAPEGKNIVEASAPEPEMVAEHVSALDYQVNTPGPANAGNHPLEGENTAEASAPEPEMAAEPLQPVDHPAYVEDKEGGRPGGKVNESPVDGVDRTTVAEVVGEKATPTVPNRRVGSPEKNSPPA